jgi:Bacterial Ig-like domain
MEAEMRTQRVFAGSLLASLAVAACGGGDSMGSSAVSTTELVSVTPPGGSTGVSATGPMVMTFSRPMMAGMQQYVDLHQGDAAGPLVAITCTWSADRLTLTCVPGGLLQPNAKYTLHMGGGMMDADDHAADMGQHQSRTGGQWLMPGMTGGMHEGAVMSGMGAGWRGPGGSYGMIFTFTTG